MSQSKIEALKNSYRKAAVKQVSLPDIQQILPHVQPLMRPTRDVSIEHKSSSLNLKQQKAPDIFFYQRKIQQLQNQIQNYQLEHQANLVYNKQFNTLGKLFGNEDLQFQQLKQKIQEAILNTNIQSYKNKNNQIFNQSYYHKPRLLSQNQYYSQQILKLTKQQLKDKLIQATRSQFLNILQLGSGIVLQNQSYEQKKRKNVRQMFYQVWGQILTNSQDITSKLHKIQSSKAIQQNQNQFKLSIVQGKANNYQSQILQKNKYISQLADELQRVNSQLIQRTSKMNFYKDNYDMLQKQYESITLQNKQLHDQIYQYKKQFMKLQDKIHEFQQKQYQDISQLNNKTQKIQLLQQQLKQVKYNKQKQCKDMILKIDQLMINVNKYDSTINQLQTQKNQMLREVWVYKANIQDLTNKIKYKEADLMKQKQKYLQLQNIFEGKQDKFISFGKQNQKRIHELNQQIITIRQQFDYKQKGFNIKMRQMQQAKQNAQNQFKQLFKQLQMLKDQRHGDSEPYTAVFGGAKLSQQLHTSIIDDRVAQLQQQLNRQQQISQIQINRLGTQLTQTIKNHEQKQRRIKQIQSFIQNIKSINMSQQTKIYKLQEQNKISNQQIQILQQQIRAYKNRIKQLQDHMQKQYISQTKQKQQLSLKLKNQKQKLKYKQKQKQKQLNNISIISSQKSFSDSASISQNQKYKQKQQQLSKIKSQLQKQIISNKIIQQKLTTSKYQIQQISNRFNQCIQMQQQYKNNINNLQQKLQNAIRECQFQKQYNAELSTKLVLLQAGGKDGNWEQDKVTIQKLKNKILELESMIAHQRKQYNIANINDGLNIKTSNKSLQAIPDKNSHSLQTISLTQLLSQPEIQQNIQHIKQQDIQQTQLLSNYKKNNKQQQHQLELYKQQILQLHNKIQQLQHAVYVFHQRDKTKHDFQNPSQIQKPTNYQVQNKQQNEQQYNQLQKYINDLQQAGDNKNNHIQQLQQLVKQKQNNMQKLQIQLSTHIQINNNKISQYTQIIDNMQQKIQQLQQQLQHNHKTIMQKDKHISQISTTLTNQMTQINKFIQQIQTIQHNNTNYNQLSKQNQELSRKYHKIQQQLQDTLQQLNTLKIYVSALKEQKQNIKQLNDTLRSQNNSIKEINSVLQQENNGLIRNYHTIQSQNKLLLATIHDLNQQISRLNNDVQHSNSNKIMHKYGNNQANRQLHTIKQIINSQNQIDQQVYQDKNIQSQHSNSNKISINNQNKTKYNNNDRLVNINLNQRENQTYRSRQQMQINQNGQQPPINQYKNRPKMQKNSLKYEQLLKQSYEIQSGSQKKQENKQMNSMKLTPQQLLDNNNNINNNNNNNEAQQIDSNSSDSKTIIWSISKINQSNLQLGGSQKLSQNGSNHIIDNRQHISPINNNKENNNHDDHNDNGNGNPFLKKPKQYIHQENLQQYNEHKQQVNGQNNIQSQSKYNKQIAKQKNKQISQSQQLQSQILSNRSEKSNQFINNQIQNYIKNTKNITQTQPPKYKQLQSPTQKFQKITQSQHNRWHNSITSSQKQSQRQQSSHIDTQYIIDQQLNKLYQQAKNDKNVIHISQTVSPNKNNISISIDNNTSNISKDQPQQQHIKSPTNNQNQVQQQSNINSMETIQINPNKIIIHQQQHNMTNINSNINSNINVHHQYNFGQLLLNTDKNINNQSNKIIQQQRQQLQHSQQYKNNISNKSNNKSNNNHNVISKKQQTIPQISFTNPNQQDIDNNNKNQQINNNNHTSIVHNNEQSQHKIQSDNSKTILQQPFQQIQRQSQKLQNQSKHPSYSFALKQPQNLSNVSPYQPTYSHQQSSIASQSSIQQSKYVQHRYISNTQPYISPQQNSSNRLYTQRNLLGDGSGYQSNINTQGRVSIISSNNRNQSSRQYSTSIRTQRIDVTPRILRWQADSAQSINQPFIKQQHQIKHNQQQSPNSISSPIIAPQSINKQITSNNSLLGYYNDNKNRNQVLQFNQYNININSTNKNQNQSSIKHLPNYSNKFISQHPSLYNGTSKNITQNSNIQKQNLSSNEQMSDLSKVIKDSGRNNSGTSNFNSSIFKSISNNNPSFYNLSSRQDVSKKQQQVKRQKFDAGLQKSLKQVSSQQDLKINIKNPQSLPQINLQQNQNNFRNNFRNNFKNNINNPYNNFMPNVIIAQPQTNFKQISHQNPYQIYKSNKQISLKLPSEYNNGIKKPNNRLDIHKSIQNHNNFTHTYPFINQTNHSIPINKTPITSKPVCPTNSGFNQYYSSPNLQNSYPAPNKVVIIQPIEKISANHLLNKNLGSKISLQNSQQVNAKKMSPSFACNKFVQLKSQPLINNPPRQISPSHNNINSISNISQPIQNPSFQIINPSINRNQINLSPPHQGSKINKKMFQTFNPSPNKKFSVYTNKLQLQRSQSPPSQRSFSPPSSTIISNKIAIQSNLISPLNNQKQLNMRQSHISYANPSSVQLKGPRFIINIRNPNQNNNLYSSNNQIILDANDHRQTQSHQSKIPQRNISKNENQTINGQNTYLISQGDQRSFQNYQSVIQIQRSNIKKPQSNSKSNIKQKITLKPVSTPPMSPTSIYGMQPPKQNNLYTISTNQQQKSQRFSSRPVTNIESPSKPINLNQNSRTQYFMNNRQSPKYQQQQQVFSSKHKIVEVLQASESSGIQIHQRDSAGYCCPNC